MTINILAVIAEPRTTPACLDAAEAAAHALGNATIEALHIVVDPRIMVAASEEISFQHLREIHEGTAKERAATTYRAFLNWQRSHPQADIPLHWRELVGCEGDGVKREAIAFDVLVLAQPTNIDGADALHTAIFSVRHPFILVPSNWRLRLGSTFAEHIIIAWNDTKACRKAVEGALPWLRQAKNVTVLLIEEDANLVVPPMELLRSEAITYEIWKIPRFAAHFLGDQILREAHALGADLLVMGAYRHHQFVEWLLGSTTRHLLAHLDLPLLAAH